MAMRTVKEWKLVLRAALRDAMRSKDANSVAMLRETLAAIDNAEAADLSLAPVAQSDVIAGAAVGLGGGDIPRRTLGPDDVQAVVERELRDRRDAATSYASLGREGDAAVLRTQADLLESLLAAEAGPCGARFPKE